MRNLVKDHFSIPIHEKDIVCCEVPIEGFLTKDKNYTVLELRPDEGRITIIDDRGLEMWARADRFRIWLDSAQFYLRLKELGWPEEEIVAAESRVFDPLTTCKDCGVKTKPGVGSARCASCWEDRCGH